MIVHLLVLIVQLGSDFTVVCAECTAVRSNYIVVGVDCTVVGANCIAKRLVLAVHLLVLMYSVWF